MTRNAEYIKDLYIVLLKLGGKVTRVERHGSAYFIEAIRPVIYQNGHTGEEAIYPHKESAVLTTT